jgi:RAQPRD family integrative conjugative element protein
MMTSTRNLVFAWRRSLVALLVVLVSDTHHTVAADDSTDRQPLAAIVRQIDLLDRLTEHVANTPPHARKGYHFDYARLHQDIERIRQGLHDYLTPQRAQPRDPVELFGDYRQSNRPSDDEDAQ